jgi:hyaluronan synthase
MRDPFLGIHLEISDDRALTNYALQSGFRTVYQSTSLVLTDAPTKLRKFTKQQLRWARGSQYNTLKMLPWMLRNTPALAAFYLANIALPFVLVACFFQWSVRVSITLESTSRSHCPAVMDCYQLY